MFIARIDSLATIQLDTISSAKTSFLGGEALFECLSL